jgi:hypothetical protein
MTTKKHAKFSPSAAHRWLGCPGSIALTEKAPPQKSSPYADEGTAAHTVLESVLKMTKVKGTATSEMIKHAREAATWILAKAGKNLVLSETKVDLTFAVPDMFGTVDAAIVEEFGRLYVIDYKYGAGIAVDPEQNPQMLAYALGLSKKYDHNFKDVVLVIIQPRAHHSRGPIREWMLPIEELISWEEKFRKGAEKALDPFAPLCAGDHCKFCPATPICPEISSVSLRQAQIEFDDKTGQLELPQPSQFSEAGKLGHVLTAIERIEFWIAEMRSYALDRLKTGERVSGFKLVDKRGSRKWTEIKKVEKEARKKFGDKAFETSLLSPAQLEKVVDADWVNSRCTNVSSGVTIAPESDSRPAVNLLAHAVAEFNEQTVSKPKKKGT